MPSSEESAPSPAFPLGTVLLPGMPLPLRLFEPRYLHMIDDVLAGPGSFVVCLIERGHEVGGGDVRSSVGTLALVTDARRNPDGTWVVEARGDERVRVEEWLADDPYPRAVISPFPDPAVGPEQAAVVDDVASVLQQVIDEMAARRGLDAPRLRAPADPTEASYLLAGLAPVPTLDRQRLLAAPTVGMRLSLTQVLLEELLLDLRRTR